MMQRTLAVLALSVLVGIALPLTVSALALDVEAAGGGGIALGGTTNPNESGAARPAGVGGINVYFYPVTVAGIDLGISAGAEYAYLTFHGVTSNISAGPLGTTTLTSDATYNYLNFPVALAGRVPLTSSIMLDVTAGGFIGDFLGGSSQNSYNPQIPLAGLTNGTITLNSSTTVKYNYGLHFTGGVDISLTKNLTLSPMIEYNLGLTNTNNESGYQYSDTLSSLTAQIGVKYNLL